MKLTISLTAVVIALLGVAVAMSGWVRPPLDSVQTGFRGLAMEEIINPREEVKSRAENAAPEALDPPEPGGDSAASVYENLQVLGHLSQNEFDRLMLAITEWVAPEEEGCLYCHNEENLAADDVYTKIVARKMIEMTWYINSDWTDHVGEVGVTCYTCHRGNPVPTNTWTEDKGPPQAGGMAAGRAGQNLAAESVGLTSLPYDPFSAYLARKDEIRVIGNQALPGPPGASIQQTEATYGLMIHMSEALGVNCTLCHNSRSFAEWDQSTPQRTTAWYGLNMVKDLNAKYLDPLQPVFPANRLGPLGDVKKTNCATCHNGVQKPLYGANMLKDYPTLKGAGN